MLDISSSEADALYAVVGDCDHDVIEALFEAFETETDLTDDQLDCLRDLIDDPAIEEALTGTFLGDDGNDTDLASAFETCTGEGG